MKMIFRADDVGYTAVHNMATFETIDNGVVTHADVMLDTPGTVDALEKLRERAWISTGWHIHFWGSPVLPASEVPSLVMEDGRFRRELRMAGDFEPEELKKEMRAQLLRCAEILGRVPDCCAMGDMPTRFDAILTEVCKEFQIPMNFMGTDVMFPEERKLPEEERRNGPFGSPKKPAEEWADKKILETGFSLAQELLNADGDSAEQYDPIAFLTEDKGRILELPEDTTAVFILHPGYVDYYVLRLGDSSPMAKNFMTSRAVDAHALCSKEVKEWIVRNDIELVNFHDALYGTAQIQTHYRAAGNPLAVKKEF